MSRYIDADALMEKCFARFFITCSWCGASTGLYFEEKHAIEMWNKRADDGKRT